MSQKKDTPAKGQPFKASNTVKTGFENTEVRQAARQALAESPVAFEKNGDKHLVFCFMAKRVYYRLNGVHCTDADDRAAMQAQNANEIVAAKAKLDSLLKAGGYKSMAEAKKIGRATKRFGKTLFDCEINADGKIVLCGE